MNDPDSVAGVPPAAEPTPAGAATSPSADGDHVTRRAAEAAREIIDRLARQAAEAEVRIRRSTDDLERRARAGGRQVREQGDELGAAVTEYVHEHPVSALAMAFGAGILASALLRR